MSHWKAYATVLIAGVLVAAPTAAHADKVWWDELGGIDCERETYFDTMGDGTIHHMPAMPYEIESSCGHAPTIDWGDTTGAVYIEGQESASEVAAPQAPAPAQPAPVAPVEPAPVVAKTAPTVPHGHTTFTRAV